MVSTSGLFGRASAGGGNLLLVVFEIGQGLLGPDPVALFDRETAYDSASASDDRRLAVGAKGCGSRIEGRNGLADNLAGAHCDGRFFFFTVSVLAVPVCPVAVGFAAAAAYEYRHE